MHAGSSRNRKKEVGARKDPVNFSSPHYEQTTGDNIVRLDGETLKDI